MPLFAPTIFAIAEIRNRHRASNTIANALGSLAIFLEFLETHAIDLEDRLDDGQLLTAGEIEVIVQKCRINLSTNNRKAVCVSSDVCGTRIRTISKYIGWHVDSRLLSRSYVHSERLVQVAKIVQTSLLARIPPARESSEPREGLSKRTIESIASIFDPNSAANAWTDKHTQMRNHLIWLLFYHLGLRAGELLGLRVTHVDFRRGTLLVKRQPDARDDPRRRQPNAKTLARELAISEVLQRNLTDYILIHRRRLKMATTHDFLFVAKSGNPLSTAGLIKIFRDVRSRLTPPMRTFTPHVLRHTWNDLFSEEMDVRNVDSEIEKKVRSYQMGWKPTSQSATVYTRRFVRRKAVEISLSLQKRAFETAEK